MNKKIMLITCGLVLLGLGYWWFNQENYYLEEAKTDELVLSFNQLDSSIESISCFALNYPVNNFSKIKPSENSSLKLPSGLNKNIICEASNGGKSVPVFWSMPSGLDLNNKTLLSRGIFANQKEIIISKFVYMKQGNYFLAFAGRADLTNSEYFNLSGEYKFTNLSKFPFSNHQPMCSVCEEKLKNNNSYYIDHVPLPPEGKVDSSLLAIWYSQKQFQDCGSVSGISATSLSKTLNLPLTENSHLSEFKWSNNLTNGWIDEEAVGINNQPDCRFNEASESWQCEQSSDGSNSFAIQEGVKCSQLPSEELQSECQLFYFNKYHKDKACVAKPFYFLGHSPRVGVSLISAMGLSFSQRAVTLSKNSLSLRTSFEFIHPLKKDKVLIPCKIMVDFSGVILQDQNKDLLVYLETKYELLDHKQSCQEVTNEYRPIKTLFKGSKL